MSCFTFYLVTVEVNVLSQWLTAKKVPSAVQLSADRTLSQSLH